MISKDKIQEIVLKNNLGKITKIKELGRGENNFNYLIIVNQNKYVLRIGIKKSLEKYFKREYQWIKKLPNTIEAPKTVLKDFSKKIIHYNYFILTYIEGKSVKKWSKRHLKLFAEALAKLHKHTYPYALNYDEEKSKKLNLYKEFIKSVEKEWNKSLLNQKNIKLIYPKIKKLVKDNNHLFTSLKKFSMVHADTYLDNILFDKDKVKLIDWEWSNIGDAAEDVGKVYFEKCSILPWMIKLNEEQLNYYLNCYMKKRKVEKGFIDRVKIYNIIHLFSDLLYFKHVSRYPKTNSNFKPEHYRKQAKKIEDYLLKI
jgi:Ser/Thr protein kinase RdoA (MazF antagonist)